MFSVKAVSALAALLSIASMAAAQDTTSSSILWIPTPTSTPKANAMQEIGCFSTGTPLDDHGDGYFPAPGPCQLICLGLNKDVLGLSEGKRCWCGDEFPPLSAQVKNESCSTPCSGYPDLKCGGKGFVWVMTTGNTNNPIDYYQPKSVGSSSVTSKPTAQVSPVIVTTIASGTSPASSSSGSGGGGGASKIGIAVGVVAGVVALAVIAGGVVFLLRRRKQIELEKEHRRQAAVSSFVNGGRLHTSASSTNDSRLDPDFMARRQSNGSIADNEDYSRRILKVTNV